MKGYIKIENVERDGHEGLSVDTELYDVSVQDQFRILHSVCQALEIQSEELHLFEIASRAGILDQMYGVSTIEETIIRAPGKDFWDKILGDKGSVQ